MVDVGRARLRSSGGGLGVGEYEPGTNVVQEFTAVNCIHY